MAAAGYLEESANGGLRKRKGRKKAALKGEKPRRKIEAAYRRRWRLAISAYRLMLKALWRRESAAKPKRRNGANAEMAGWLLGVAAWRNENMAACVSAMAKWRGVCGVAKLWHGEEETSKMSKAWHG
jgi:hypothetical protein